MADIKPPLDTWGRAIAPVQVFGGATPPAAPETSAYTATPVAASSAGDNTLLAGTASQTIRVFAIAITAPAGATVDVAIKDGAGITLATFKAVGSLVLDPLGVNPRWVLTAGNALILNLSSAVAVTGSVWTTKG